jgi:hypothetical protein
VSTKLHYGTPMRNPKTGKVGAHLIIDENSDGWFARYETHTHGLSPSEVAQRVAEVKQRHKKWARRMDGFAAVLDVEIVVAKNVYRIVDCTIPSRTYEHGEVIVGVRRVDGENLVKVEGFPVALPFSTIDEAPANARIIEEIRQRLVELHDRREAHKAYTSKVNALARE